MLLALWITLCWCQWALIWTDLILLQHQIKSWWKISDRDTNCSQNHSPVIHDGLALQAVRPNQNAGNQGLASVIKMMVIMMAMTIVVMIMVMVITFMIIMMAWWLSWSWSLWSWWIERWGDEWWRGGWWC